MRPRPAPRDAAYAADIIATLKAQTKSKPARIKMARLAIDIGNYTDEAKAVWRKYYAEECA